MKMPAVLDMVSKIKNWFDYAISFGLTLNPADTTQKFYISTICNNESHTSKLFIIFEYEFRSN